MSFYGTMHGDAAHAHAAGYSITPCRFCHNWVWTQTPSAATFCARRVCEARAREAREEAR